MTSAASAIRNGLATLPVSSEKSSAYFISNSFHGIRSAILTRRLFGFILSPIGWLKSRKECCNLSSGLYMCSTPLSVNGTFTVYKKVSPSKEKRSYRQYDYIRFTFVCYRRKECHFYTIEQTDKLLVYIFFTSTFLFLAAIINRPIFYH